MNVVHICDKFGVRGSTVHGAARLFAWWLPRFDHERFNVKLYAVKRPDPSSRALEAEGLQMSYLGKSAFDPSTLTSFLSVIRREQADILHVHGWIASNFGRIAGRLTGVPTIMHEHGVDPSFPMSQRLADRIMSPFTHTAVAVSESARNFLISHRSVSPRKIRVIYNGAPLGEFSRAAPVLVAQARKEFGIAPSSRIVGVIGRLDTQKGITYFIKAAQHVLDAASEDVRFLIIGDGPKRQELEQEASELGLAGSVLFTGHRSDVPVIQSLLDVQVFPSLWEGVPLTIFEAMAMRRAIVSTNVDGLGEVLNDGEDSLIVDPANPEKLAAGILKLLFDRELADKLRAGAAKQSEKFDISQTVRNLESLYEELYAAPRNER